MSAKKQFPYEIKALTPGQDKAVRGGIYDPMGGMICVGPHNMVLPTRYRDVAEEIYTFEPREDDVWIATFPRSGTTVTQELIWLIANDLDFEGAREHLIVRFPYLEMEMFTPEAKTLEQLKETTSRRFIKTHLMFHLHNPDLFKKGSKIIYVARNPKDVMVSFYHFHRLIEKATGFTGDFEKFFDYFINDAVFYTPYWEHLLQGWEKRNEPNYLFIFYEDFRKDAEGTIKKVADFLEKPLTKEEVQTLQDHLDINNFRKNSAVNTMHPQSEDANPKENFVRKGEVKSWMKYLTEEMNEKIDRLIREKFEPAGLNFDCC